MNITLKPFPEFGSPGSVREGLLWGREDPVGTDAWAMRWEQLPLPQCLNPHEKPLQELGFTPGAQERAEALLEAKTEQGLSLDLF